MQQLQVPVAAVAALLTAGAFAAQTQAPDYAALVKRVPAPPASVTAAGAQAKDHATVAGHIDKLHGDMGQIHRALEVTAAGGGSSAAAGADTLAAMGVHDQASAEALKAKMARMSRQERMAFAMRLRQRQVRAAMTRRHAAPAGLSPEARQALDRLGKVEIVLRGPFNDSTGRYGPSFVDALNMKLAAVDADLDKALKALDARYAVPSERDLGYKGLLYPERVAGYLHAHKLCHRYWDNRIQRAQAKPLIYDNWLSARAAAWSAQQSKLVELAVHEHAALSQLPAALPAHAAPGVQAVQMETLDAIDGLIRAAQGYRDNNHYHDMDAISADNPDAANHDARVAAAITGGADALAGNLNACIAGTY